MAPAAVVGVCAVALVACFTQRLHDDTLDCSDGPCRCVAGRANCDGDWTNGCEIDLQANTNHCGGCEQFCQHGHCIAGTCSCHEPTTWNDCDQDRANGCETYLPGDDRLNCGQCDNECGITAVCQDGICTEQCLNGMLCGELCVDESKDPDHCGYCDHPCDPDQACFDGTCQPCERVCGLCLDRDLGADLPQDIIGVPTANGLVSLCWLEPLPGTIYLFHPPSAGSYLINTFGSTADTALSIRAEQSPSCTEMDCSDEGIGSASAIELQVNGLDNLVIEVASKSGIDVSHQLHITETSDPFCDLGWLGWTMPVAHSADFVAASDVLQPSCAPSGGPEVAALLVAPTSGYYLIDTNGSEANTVLYVLDDHCSGTELGCDDDTGDQDAQLVLPLDAGQAVVVVVELRANSTPGPYELHVEGPL